MLERMKPTLVYFVGFILFSTFIIFLIKTLPTMSRREDVDTFSSLSLKSSGKDKSEQITECPRFVLFCAF